MHKPVRKLVRKSISKPVRKSISKPVRKSPKKSVAAVKAEARQRPPKYTENENAEREAYEFNVNSLEKAADTKPAEFTAEMFNQNFQSMVHTFTLASDSDPAYVIATLHATTSLLLSGLYVIQPDVHNTSFTISPNLSGLLIGNSGVKKSPALHAITKAIYARENHIALLAEKALIELNKKNEMAKLRNYTINQEINKLSREKLRHEDENPQKAQELGQQIENLMSKNEEVNQHKFTSRKLIVGTPTLMGLVTVLSQQSTPVMLIKDEISDFICTSSSPTGDSQRALLMVIMDGQGTESYERANKEPLKLADRKISIIGTTQPERLSTLVTNVYTGKIPNDGFLSRFNLIAYPHQKHSQKKNEEFINPQLNENLKKWETFVNELDSHKPVASPDKLCCQTVHFTSTALIAYNDFTSANKVHKEHLHPLHQSLLSKQESLVPSLALINAIFDKGSVSAFAGVITEKDVKMAIQQAKVYESHFVHFFKLTPEKPNYALLLLNKLKKSKFNTINFTVSQIHKQDWSLFKTTEMIESALELLEEYQLVYKKQPPKLPKGGRPTVYWSIVIPS